MQTPTKTTAHSVYNLNYHIVFVTKYRNKVLIGAAEEYVKEQIPVLCERYGWEMLAIEVMPDHVHLFLPIEGDVKGATIKQEAGGNWYVVFVSHLELPDVAPTCESPVGIDVGLTSFLTLDNGEKVEPPKFYRRAERKLKRLQRQLSRCQKTSANRSRAKLRVAKHHRRTANQRNDFLHKLSARLVAEQDTLCIEDLNLKGLTRTKLAKSFSEPGTFR